jgi:hypothetical protein
VGLVSMAGVLSAFGKAPKNYGDVEFWHTPERTGWLMKQGEHRNLQRHGESTSSSSVLQQCMSSCLAHDQSQAA